MMFIKKNKIFKLAALMFVTALILGAAQFAPGAGAALAGDLDIYKDGNYVTSYSYAQLENDFDQFQHVYSTYNTFPTRFDYVARGPMLKDILESVGIDPHYGGTIKFTSSKDERAMTHTIGELTGGGRYNFPADGSQEESVETHVRFINFLKITN